MQHCCHFDNPALLRLSSALFSFGAFFCSRCTPLSLEDPLLRLSFAKTLTELSSVMTERLHAYLTHCKTVQNSARNCRNHQLSKKDEQCTSLLRCSYITLIQEFQAMPNAINTPTFWKASIAYKKYTANLTPFIQTSLSITQLHNSASKPAFYFINSKV